MLISKVDIHSNYITKHQNYKPVLTNEDNIE